MGTWTDIDQYKNDGKEGSKDGDMIRGRNMIDDLSHEVGIFLTGSFLEFLTRSDPSTEPKRFSRLCEKCQLFSSSMRSSLCKSCYEARICLN